MANANPSRPGVDPTAGKMQINVFAGETLVKKLDGRLVKMDESQTGVIRETEVFAGDYVGKDAKVKGVKIVKESDLIKQREAAEKATSKESE